MMNFNTFLKKKDGQNLEKAIDYSKAIQSLANKNGYTLPELCERASLSKSYEKRIESGYWNPKIITLAKLCRALNIELITFCHYARTGKEIPSFSVKFAHSLDFVYSSRHFAYAIKILAKVQNKTLYSLRRANDSELKNFLILAKNKPRNQITIASLDRTAQIFGITAYAMLTWLHHTAVITYHYAIENGIGIVEESHTDNEDFKDE